MESRDLPYPAALVPGSNSFCLARKRPLTSDGSRSKTHQTVPGFALKVHWTPNRCRAYQNWHGSSETGLERVVDSHCLPVQASPVRDNPKRSRPSLALPWRTNPIKPIGYQSNTLRIETRRTLPVRSRWLPNPADPRNTEVNHSTAYSAVPLRAHPSLKSGHWPPGSASTNHT